MVFGIAVLVSFVWFGLQILGWLSSGEWISATPATLGVDPLNTTWVGMNESWRWVCAQSVHIHLWVAGWVVSGLTE